ncbi:unnamed protein product [Ilex paraguariensis]|uniref:Rhodanese domain-containing protein n=1 Tax=Ilex paraguariensis TaxID=185542 RepID=A0ABC8RN24_9AQUA
MEALNAVGLTPISVLSDKRIEPRKSLSLPIISPCKSPNFANYNPSPPNISKVFPRSTVHGGLVLLSSVLSTEFARALTYEEALQQLVGTSTSSGSSYDFDFSGFLDSAINFGVENPTVIAGGVAILALPLVLSLVFSKLKPWGVEFAKTAYAKLGDDANAQLLDIRAPVELRQVGSPDLRGLKKKPVSVVYKGENKPGFLKKLSLKLKEPESTTLFILDRFDGNSELVAELVTANGFKAAYAIKDGVEGNRGWMSSGLPWILPAKVPSLDPSNLTDAISGALGEGSDAVPLTLGIAAATGLGLLAFTEVETILQLLGSAALLQFVSKKFLFAEDRKQTLQQVDEFLNTKQIGKALLPSPVTGKALTAPAEASSPVADSAVQKAEAVPELNPEPPKVETAVEPEINSVPKVEVKAKSLAGISSSLSPYPNPKSLETLA